MDKKRFFVLLAVVVCVLAVSSGLFGQSSQFTWTQVFPGTNPPGRTEMAMAYDTAHSQVVLFGGMEEGTFTLLNDTWLWNGTTWIQRFPSTSPSARVSHSVVYDSLHQTILLFGGWDSSSGSMNDTWLWDGTNWTEQFPAAAPSHTDYGAMAFDTARGQAVFVGGYNPALGTPNETWVWDGNTWIQKATSTPQRNNFAMAFDASHNRVVLFGGDVPTGTSGVVTYSTDTWTWDGNTWTQNITSSAPPGRHGTVMEFDQSIGHIILFGGLQQGGLGYLNDTWLWDGTNWTEQFPVGSPSARVFDAAAYDLARDVIVLFAGTNGNMLDDTWLLRRTAGVTCQVASYTPFHQYDALPLSDRYEAWTQYPPLTPGIAVPQYFGFLPNPNGPPAGEVNPYVVCPTIVSGCLLTSAATMLTSFSSLASTTPTGLDTQLKTLAPYGQSFPSEGGGISLCPQSAPACSTPSVGYPDWCEFIPANLNYAYPQVVALAPSGQVSQSQLYDANQGAFVSLNQYLNDYVCTNGDRVILQLSETATDSNGTVTHPGFHYVFVTGQSGTDWTIFDPGWNPAYTSPAGNLSSLAGHEAGFLTCPNGDCSIGVFRQFSVAGVRSYKDISSTGANGGLSVTADSPVELLVLDPEGRQLGNLNGQDVFGIPEGSYMREYPLTDDTGTGTANGDPTGIKTAYISSPEGGTFQVTATGTAPGTYTLTFRTLANDGSVQTATFVGLTNVGTLSTYQLPYSPSPGASGPVMQTVTFQSTLGDISNSLALGLIKERDLAIGLSAIIDGASAAAGHRNKALEKTLLNAFKIAVEFAASKRGGQSITGLAPQILLADANSLLSQLR